MREFDDYFKKNSISHKVTTPYLPKQNGIVKKVNYIIMGLFWAIWASQKLPKSL